MMSHSPSIHSDYLRTVFHPAQVKRLMREAVPLLKQYDFEAIAFRGMSGALVAPILAYKTNKTLVMVRKPKSGVEDTHSWLQVEGDLAMQRYIIVDDFICSGRTLNNVVQEISLFAPNAKCLGVLLYQRLLQDNQPLRIECIRYPREKLQSFMCCNPEHFRIYPKGKAIKIPPAHFDQVPLRTVL